jgi:hypothetical protein
MGSSLIKVENIGIEEAMEVLLLENEEVIQAFSPHTDPRSKDAHGDEGSWLKNAGAFHHRQVH